MTKEMTLEEAAAAFREATRQTIERHSTWYLVQGLLMLVVGIVALLYPVVSSVAVVLLLGWLLIISGVFQGITLISARHVPHFWLQLISVVLSLIVGVLFLTRPGEGLLSLTLLLVVFFMVGGISKIVMALTIRPFPNWSWVLVSGIIGILLAMILWSMLPIGAVWILGIMVGVQLICEGTALAYMAWAAKQRRAAPSHTASSAA